MKTHVFAPEKSRFDVAIYSFSSEEGCCHEIMFPLSVKDQLYKSEICFFHPRAKHGNPVFGSLRSYYYNQNTFRIKLHNPVTIGNKSFKKGTIIRVPLSKLINLVIFNKQCKNFKINPGAEPRNICTM